MFNRNAIKAEAGVLVPVYEKDKDGKPVLIKDKTGKLVKKVSEYLFENAFYHPHIPKSKWIKLDDPLMVARMFRDFKVKINQYAVFLPASGKEESGGWQMLSLEEAVTLAESGERELVIDTQKHGTVKEGDAYRERKLRLKLRLTSEKKAKSVIDADDYFDVAAFYTQKAKK